MHLAIDTATDNAGLALLDAGCVIFELTWRCLRNHTAELLPRLSDLMTRHKVRTGMLRLITVALGPGSFNGVRVGVSTAKGLALSLGIPLAGISTLAAEAYQHSLAGLPVTPVFNAGRNEIVTATYRMKNSEWARLLPERITTLDGLIQETDTETVFCGEYLPNIEGELRSRLGNKAVIPPRAARLRRAVYLAELGQKEFEAGRTADPITLQPVYLRRPAITLPKRR